MALTGEQCVQLCAALCEAFESEDSLVQMVRFKLGRNLAEDVGLKRPLKDEVFDLIRLADEEGSTEALIRAAYSSRPNKPKMLAFLDQHFPALKTPVAAEELIGTVRQGFDALAQLVQQLADPGARAIIGRFRGDFGVARDKSRALGRYKRLHDRLHALQ